MKYSFYTLILFFLTVNVIAQNSIYELNENTRLLEHSALVNSKINTNTDKMIIFGIRGAIKLSDASHTKTDSGPWGGLYVNMPTGLGWSLQLEYNVWNASLHRTNDKIFSTEWAFLVTYNKYFNNIYLQLLVGPGIFSSGESWIGGNRDLLFSFNFAASIGIAVSKHLESFLQFRQQWAASLEVGGGRVFLPFLIGVGIQFRTN